MPLNIFRRRERTPDRSSHPDTLTLTAPLDVQAADSKKKVTFSLVANTGVPMRVDGFMDPVLVVLEGAHFEKDVTPVIMDHDTKLRVGHTTRQSIDAKGITASGVVSSGMNAARGFVEDAKAGFPFQVSIGASIDKAVFVPEGETVSANGTEFDGPLLVATETTIKELSVTVLGADSSTSVTVAATRPKGRDTMPLSQTELQDHRRALAEEELRVDKIRDIAASKRDVTLRGCSVKNVGSVAELKAHAISEGWAPEEFELELVRAERPTNLHSFTGSRREGTMYGTPSKVIEAALLQRTGARHARGENARSFGNGSG